MNFLHTALLGALLHLWMPPGWGSSEPEPPLTKPERAALAYLCTQPAYHDMCVSPQRQPVALLPFQQELATLRRKYTYRYLDSVDARGPQRSGAAAPASACAFEAVFPCTRMDDLLVCEVFPQGDRTFTASVVYLFQVKRQRVRFLSKQEVAYN